MIRDAFDKKKDMSIVLKLNGEELRHLWNMLASVDQQDAMTYYHPIAEKVGEQLREFVGDYTE